MAVDWVDSNNSPMSPMDNDDSNRSPSYYSEDPSSSQGDYQGVDSQVDSYQGDSHNNYQDGSHDSYEGGDGQGYYQGLDSQGGDSQGDSQGDNYDDGGNDQGYYQEGDSQGDDYDEDGDNYDEPDNYYHQDGPEQEAFDREVSRHTSSDRLVELETDDEISYVQSHQPQPDYHGSYNSNQSPDEDDNDDDNDDDDDDDDDEEDDDDNRYRQTGGGWIGKYTDESESNPNAESFHGEDTNPTEYTFGGSAGQQDTSERSNMTNTYYQPTQFAGPMTPHQGNFQQYEATEREMGRDDLFQNGGPQQQQQQQQQQPETSPVPINYGYEPTSPLRSMEESLKIPMSDQDFGDKDGVDDGLQMHELKRVQQWNMFLVTISCILLLALIVVVPVLVTRDDNENIQNVPIVPPVDSPTVSPITSTKIPTRTLAPSSGGPRVCFESSQELQDAVDEYLAASGDEAQLEDLISVRGWPIGTWCVSKITNFNSLFAVSRNMQAVNFNADLALWDTSNATDLGSMFDGARVFDGDVTRWKTSQVVNMTRTFSGATQFNQDLSLWDVSQVTSLRDTFFRATTFNKNIANWDVSRVASMRNTFLSAAAFNQDLTAWQLDSVADMNSMFAEANSFRQNMCAWGKQLQNRVVDVGRMFENTACPLGLVSPSLTGLTPGPFCFACILGLFPTTSPSQAPVIGPDIPTVAVPTGSPTTQESELFQLICDQIPDCSVLRDTSTPQGQAFAWLEQPANSAIFTDTKKIQRYALATLYFSTSGPEWSTSTFWLSSVDECLWFSTTSGSACTDVTREYQALELEKNILTGSLPFEISLLRSLKTMNLAGNLLQGELSSAMGRMVTLETLLLQANFLSGNIPSELVNLTKLTQLRLDNNDFVGDLPEDLCTLATAGRLTIFLDCEEVTASCFTTCCSNEAPCE